MNACAARAFDAAALPALNPNHPNHRSAAPIATKVRLFGRRRVFFLLPRISTPTKAAIPAFI